MKLIEREMVRAIDKGWNWRKDNTEVRVDEAGIAQVYLYGNHIAEVGVFGEVRVDRKTLAHWPTNVTKSRLRALGCDVYTRNFVTYVDGEAV